MGALYPYSLIPVLSVSTLLFFTAVRRWPRARGLTLYCLAIALWSGDLMMIWIPGWATVGERAAAIGAFVAATYLHAAYDATRQKSYRLVILAYVMATALTLAGVLQPGVLYGPRAMTRGPLFWPGMLLAVTAASIPLVALARSYRTATPTKKATLQRLFLAGLLGYGGGLGNAILLSGGSPSPLPMLGVLGSLFLTANVIRSLESPSERRVLERSLLYAAIAAFLSAGFLFGVMQLVASAPPAGIGQYRLGAFFLLCMAALAFEPLRQHLQEALTRSFTPDRAPATALSRALTEQEARADHAERLAVLGALTSAVAHEVRNPLGVMTALVHQLERDGANTSTVDALREQIGRASHFVTDLLAYGRPQPLELRTIDVFAVAQLAASSARQGLGHPSEHVKVEIYREGAVTVEGDQHQLLQALVALIDNALLAVVGRDAGRIDVHIIGAETVDIIIEDDGPGFPDELLESAFDPFITGRPRNGPRPGTGLGLTIVKGIVDRHRGSVRAGRSPTGGAQVVVSLPHRQPALATEPTAGAERTAT